MDTVTQQNAALVEQAAAAAESLQDQARALEQAVSVFRLDAGAAGAVAHAAPNAVPKAAPPRPAARSAPQQARAALGRATARPAPRPAAAPARHLKAVPASTEGDWEEF